MRGKESVLGIMIRKDEVRDMVMNWVMVEDVGG